jgi:hypothetical protein
MSLQEELLMGKVSVVPFVKPLTMEKISRATGARILSSMNYLDKLPEHDILGCTAGKFSVITIMVPPDWHSANAEVAAMNTNKRGRATYTVLDKCPEHSGCTVILRGHANDIGIIKKILLVRLSFGGSLSNTF